MALFSTIITTFSTTLADKIAEKVVGEVASRLDESLAIFDKYKRIDKRGRELKDELELAQTDDEYKAILNKVHSYLSNLDKP